MSDYLSVVYNKEVKPYTSYPQKFISHLFDLYGMKQGRRLLEPGVGRGEFLRLFKELGLEVSGLDISEKARNAIDGNGANRISQEITKYYE